jgi:DNA-binding MarR family transcriptional regulator
MPIPETLETVYSSICGAIRDPKLPDLTVRQLGVMLFLSNKKKNDIYSSKNLSEVLGLGKPAITRACDTLVQKGYLVRKIHPYDARMINLALTQSGQAYLKRMAKSAEPFQSTLLAA